MPVPSITIQVLATFSKAVTTAAITYSLNNLVGKLSGDLKPKHIAISTSGGLQIDFYSPNSPSGDLMLAAMDKYEAAVDQALSQLAKEPKSPLPNKSWIITETKQSVTYS